MLLEDALRTTLRNFSTLFLVIFAVLGPLHFLYAFVFHDVLALRELHPAISDFPASRQVRGVGRGDLGRAQIWFWVLAVVELFLLPVFTRVAAHVIAMDERGEVPTATQAWRRIGDRAALPARPAGGVAGVVAAALLLGVAVASLVERTLMVIADLAADSAAFALIGLARSVGHSAGGVFLVVALVVALAHSEAPRDKVPELY